MVWQQQAGYETRVHLVATTLDVSGAFQVRQCDRPSGLSRYKYAHDEDGDGFCEVHVNTIEGFWSLLRSWLRPHRGISQDKLPLYLGFFQFVHNARRRGKALLGALIAAFVR
jgi:transposase-like protein